MTTNFDAQESIAQALWKQWRAVGVHAAAPSGSELIDPEALLIESAISAHQLQDPRIADGAISWAVRHHDLIITARLKTLLNGYDASQREAFLMLSRRVADNVGRLTWPAAESASPWTPSTDVKLPRLSNHPALLRLRTRALFGANARAEAVAFLTSVGAKGTDLAVIEAATLFSKRYLAIPLQQLVDEGSVERWWLGNRQRFRLSPKALEFLGYPRHELQMQPKSVAGTSIPQVLSMPTGPEWVDWRSRFALARVCGRAFAQLREPTGPVMAMSDIQAHSPEFHRTGLHTPAPLQLNEDPASRRDELEGWLSDAIERLTTA